jgi:type II secretory pathway component PulM
MAGEIARPTGFLASQWDAMTPRDRKLLGVLVAFFSVVGLGLTLFLLKGVIDDRAQRVQDAQDSLDVLTAMADEYEAANRKVQAGEADLSKYADKPMSAYLEEAARDASLSENLTAVNEQGTEVVGKLRQTRYKVELKKIPLDKKYGLEFVHAIETSGYPLRIDLARFKTVMVSGDKQIDMTLELTGFQLAGGGT